MVIDSGFTEAPERMPPAQKAQLGAAVRKRRQQLGMTQGDLASAAQIADETVSRIERGRLTPSVVMTERIAGALRTTVNDLLSARSSAKEPKLRPSEAKLLALVRSMNDTAVEDVVRAVKTLLAVGRSSGS